MKIGIVKHLNARPLTYYFEKTVGFEIVSDHPSLLVEDLKLGKIDLALISSIECERNSECLSYSKAVGVCANDLVRSVLYFQNTQESQPTKEIYTDNGSRASVALLQCLFYLAYGFIPKVLPTPALKIEEMMKDGIGSHMLFGDHALLHQTQENYQIVDLATWWNQLTDKYFCFAFWAFKKPTEVEDVFLINALKFGIEHINEIVQNEKRLPTAIVDRYLKTELQFYPQKKNLEGFDLYIATCRKIGLISKI